MNTAKDDILEKIRQANGTAGGNSVDAYSTLPREYLSAIATTPEERIGLFIDRLVDYDAKVDCCREQDIAATVAKALTTNNNKSMLIPQTLSRVWLPPSFEFVVGDELSYADLNQSEGVLTGCALGIAMTGTILLRHPREEGPRALTLIPDYHLCVVFARTLVDTVPEGIRTIREAGAAAITTVSGPSATADIEMTRVKGVHGPRFLEVILVRD
jgi:L-lactate dehydrogenase complex protein LldG